MFLRTPAKAIKYAFVLKKQTGLNISDNCLARLSYANKVNKEIQENLRLFAQSAGEYFSRGMDKLMEIEGKHMEP